MKGRQEPRLANLPAFHTSDGAGVGNIIRVAGMEPFPWQDLVYKYVLARNESGKLRFPTVGLSVPRQSVSSHACWRESCTVCSNTKTTTM